MQDKFYKDLNNILQENIDNITYYNNIDNILQENYIKLLIENSTEYDIILNENKFLDAIKDFFIKLRKKLGEMKKEFIKSLNGEKEQNNDFLKDHKEELLKLKEAEIQPYKDYPYWNSDEMFDKIVVPKFDVNSAISYIDGSAIITFLKDKVQTNVEITKENMQTIINTILIGNTKQKQEFEASVMKKRIPELITFCESFDGYYTRIKMDEQEIEKCVNQALNDLNNQKSTVVNNYNNNTSGKLFKEDSGTLINNTANVETYSSSIDKDIKDLSNMNKNNTQNEKRNKEQVKQTEMKQQVSNIDKKIRGCQDFAIYCGYILSAKRNILIDKNRVYRNYLSSMVKGDKQTTNNNDENIYGLNAINEKTDETNFINIDNDLKSVKIPPGNIYKNIPAINRYIKQNAIVLKNNLEDNINKKELNRIKRDIVNEGIIKTMKMNAKLWSKVGSKRVISLQKLMNGNIDKEKRALHDFANDISVWFVENSTKKQQNNEETNNNNNDNNENNNS